MTLFDFAFKNIIRDKRNYLYYFINCVFSVFVFFLFTVLSFHPAMSVIDTHSSMGMILIVGELVSIFFSLCFLSYSAGCFLKSRSKQFGLITIIGASKKQLNRLIFLENMIIGFTSIVTGILLGFVFSKLFLDIANRIIGVSDFVFYFPTSAIMTTIVIFGIVFLLIAYFTPKFIRKKEIIKLLKVEIAGEKKVSLYPFTILTVFLIITLAFLYVFQNEVYQTIAQSLLFPIVLAILIFLITFVLFGYGLKFFVKFANNNNIGMLSCGEIKSKMRSNLRVMTISTVLYAISFFAIIVLFSLSSNVKTETEKIMPYAMSYNTWNEKTNVEADIKKIDSILKNQEDYKTMHFNLYSLQNNSRTAIMPQREYNQIMKFLHRETIELARNEVYLVAGNVGDNLQEVPYEVQEQAKSNDLNLKVAGSTGENIMLTGFVDSISICNDDDFGKIKNNLSSKPIYIFDYKDWEIKSNVVKQVTEIFEEKINNREVNIIHAYGYYQSSLLQNNLTLYIGSMLCFTFILAVASFIYSRLYSELELECKKYKGIVKIGLSKKELGKLLNKETRLVLLVPFVIALVYLWIGVLISEKYMIVSNLPVSIVSTMVLIVIQIILYIIINFAYKNAVFEKIYMEM